MESVSPNLYVHDLRVSMDFYSKLGFSVVVTVPEAGEPIFAMMVNGGVTFMLQTFESLGHEMKEISRNPGGSLLLYLKVTDVRGYYARLKDQVKVIREPETTFYGATEFSIEDPNGFVLTLAEDEVA